MTAATITAASSTRAERSEKRVSSVKLPSNPFAGKQYLGLILPLALIALWYILSTNGVFTQVQLPSPTVWSMPVLSWRSAASWAATWQFLLSVC